MKLVCGGYARFCGLAALMRARVLYYRNMSFFSLFFLSESLGFSSAMLCFSTMLISSFIIALRSLSCSYDMYFITLPFYVVIVSVLKL